MFVVDTNVLVYAVNQDCQEHERCHSFLEGVRKSTFPWYLTWPVIYEFLRVVTHPRVFARPLANADAWSFIVALRTSPSLGILSPTERHGKMLEAALKRHSDLRGNLMHDLHTCVLMQEHGIRRIYTRDTDFHRFPSLEVIDPLRVD